MPAPPSSSQSWLPVETSTYVDHVIKHVLGAAVLGWVVIDDAMHVLLDVGLLWTIYVNGEMSLMAQGVAIEDLEGNDLSHDEVLRLASDAQLLISKGREVTGLYRFNGAPVDCTIIAVEVFASGGQRRIEIAGDTSDIEIETFPDPPEFNIQAKPHAANV